MQEPSQRTTKEQLRAFRRTVADAVGELRSQEARNTYAALSLEELMDQHIARLELSNDPINPSRLQRMKKIRDALLSSIEAMKATPPDAFLRRSSADDANTPVEET